MHEVKIDRIELLDRIRKNRDKHEADYSAAMEEYRQAVKLELQDWLKRAEQGEDVDRGTRLIKPQDHLKEYDRVIDMLEMSVDDNITLDSHSFDQYVRDEWQWKQGFVHGARANTAYIADSLGR